MSTHSLSRAMKPSGTGKPARTNRERPAPLPTELSRQTSGESKEKMSCAVSKAGIERGVSADLGIRRKRGVSISASGTSQATRRVTAPHS